jgi:hypothetical protein
VRLSDKHARLLQHVAFDPLANISNTTLAYHAGKGNAKGVQLCLWAGADPHDTAASLCFRTTVDECADEISVQIAGPPLIV